MSSTTAQATMPIPENGTVPPWPVPQAQRRPREYLTPKEVERLIAAARQNRYGPRDSTMIRVAYRHGLRVAELCALR
jgi:integrase